jgi:hypothetical protein
MIAYAAFLGEPPVTGVCIAAKKPYVRQLAWLFRISLMILCGTGSLGFVRSLAAPQTWQAAGGAPPLATSRTPYTAKAEILRSRDGGDDSVIVAAVRRLKRRVRGKFKLATSPFLQASSLKASAPERTAREGATRPSRGLVGSRSPELMHLPF